MVEESQQEAAGKQDCDTLQGQDSPGAGGELSYNEVQHEAPEGDEIQPVNNVNILFLLDSVVLTYVPEYNQ